MRPEDGMQAAYRAYLTSNACWNKPAFNVMSFIYFNDVDVSDLLVVAWANSLMLLLAKINQGAVHKLYNAFERAGAVVICYFVLELIYT